MHVISKGKKSSPIAKDINFFRHLERKNPNSKTNNQPERESPIQPRNRYPNF